MLTPEERIKVCSTCRKRKLNMETGLVCELTDEKPVFEDTCPSFDEDTQEVERIKEKEKQVEDSKEVNGFLAFYVAFLVPMGILVTLISHIINWDSVTGYGSTFLTLFEIAFLFFYVYFQAYTIYGFNKKKPDVVFIAKYQSIVLVVVNLLILLTGATDSDSVLNNAPRLATSTVWGIIFFLYFCFSEDVKDLIPPEKRKLTGFNKIMFILSIVIPIVLYICGIFELTTKTYGANRLSGPEKQIQAMCDARHKDFPIEVSDGMTWTDVYVDDSKLVFAYEYDDASSDVIKEAYNGHSELLALYQREMAKLRFVGQTMDIDPVMGQCAKAGYDVGYKFSSSDGQEIFSYSFSPEEYKEMLSGQYEYSTSDEDLGRIITLYDELLPIPYFEDCTLTNCSISDTGKDINYSLRLENMDMSTLSGLSNRALKEYMIGIIPELSDIPLVFALLNEKNIVYKFTADCSDWWNVSVRITPPELEEVIGE